MAIFPSEASRAKFHGFGGYGQCDRKKKTGNDGQNHPKSFFHKILPDRLA